MNVSRLAVESGVWPLFEIVDGAWRMTGPARKTRPVVDYVRVQGRFKHLMTEANAGLLAEVQARIDADWERLLKRCAADA